MQSFIGLLLLIIMVVSLGLVFFQNFYNILVKKKNIYTSLNLLKMIFNDEKNFSPNRIILHY